MLGQKRRAMLGYEGHMPKAEALNNTANAIFHTDLI